jgi:D-alanine-D-alanine ligase
VNGGVPGRVAVIGGGTASEHDVSCSSAAGIATALAASGWEPLLLTIRRDGSWECADGAPLSFAAAVDLLSACVAAVPTVHGPVGEDGTLAALCELARVPFVGSGVRAGALAMDKWATKLVAEAVGVRTTPGVLLGPADASAYSFVGPVVVKPVTAGSSHGVTLVRTREELQPALTAAFALDDRVLVEDHVVGREIDVAVLGHGSGRGAERCVAPALEIFVDGIFDTGAKYDSAPDFLVPARLTRGERRALERDALRMYDALGCSGVARVDFFLTSDGPVLNEVNTAPGFTEHSQVPRMFAAAGVSYAELVDRLVRDALR